MKYHEISAGLGKKSRKRVGRGISAGGGKTAGRGTKGQNARSGGSVRPGFEGGQNPLMQRLPKLPGFKSRRQKPQTVRLGRIGKLKAATVDNPALYEAGIIERLDRPVRVVAGGEYKSKKTVKLAGASKAARQAIEKAGGKFVKTAPPGKQKRRKS